jgi:hypothetical protein
VAQFSRIVKLGGVVERLMAPVLKTGRAQALVGSNPTPSASSISDFGFRISELHSTRDEVSGERTDQCRGHNVREMMRRNVHARKSDEQRNRHQSKADPP